MSLAPVPQNTQPTRITSSSAPGQKPMPTRGNAGHQSSNTPQAETSKGVSRRDETLTADELTFKELMDADRKTSSFEDEPLFDVLAMAGHLQDVTGSAESAESTETTEATFRPLNPLGADMPRMISQMTESLAPQLQSAAQQALEVSIHLPRLGRIRVNTQHDKSGWQMTLHSEDRDVRHLLAQHQSHCENALQQALGQNVSMHVSDRAPA